MTFDTSIAFVGFYGTGKTTYLGALWQIIQDPRDTTMTEVEVLGDRSHLQFIGEQVARGERLLRTDVESEGGLSVTVRFNDGPVVALNVPDLSGEAVRVLVEDRVWHPRLSDAVLAADAIVFFVSPRPFRLPIRSSFTDDLLADFLAQTADIEGEETEDAEASGEADDATGADPMLESAAASAAGNDGVTEIEFQTRLACTAAHVIDAIENVLALRSNRIPLRVAVVVSAWDSVDPSMTPGDWVQHRLPALGSFIKVNSDRVNADIFGVSAQGGRLPEQRDELLAKGDVLDRVFAKSRTGEPVAFAEPLRWAVEG